MPAEVVKIGDLSEEMHKFMITSIAQDYERTDLTDGSPTADVILAPLLECAPIIMDAVNRAELRATLNNHNLMIESDLDDLCEGNYFNTRIRGTKASGPVTICLSSVSQTEPTYFVEGKRIRSKQGLLFTIKETTSYSVAEAAAKYNATSFFYEFEIMVEAENVGAIYNIMPGDIVDFEDAMPENFKEVKSFVKFSGGTDTETSESYISRTKNFLSTRNLEKGSGYKADIQDRCPEVVDLYSAGKGDPLMVRDRASSITIGGVTLTNVSIGGAVDIYIRGRNIDTGVVTLACQNNRLALNVPASKIKMDSIVATNGRTAQVIANAVVTTEDTRVIVFIPEKNASNVVQLVSTDTIDVTYSVDMDGDGSWDATPRTQSFIIKANESPILSPLEAVSSILNETTGAIIDAGNGFTKTDVYSTTNSAPSFAATSRESMTLKTPGILATNTTNLGLCNGDSIKFTYAYNKTLRYLGDTYDIGGDRVITRDILFKMANIAYMHNQIRVRTKEGIAPTSFHTSAITAAISNYYDSIPMGGRIDESDIITKVQSDPTCASFIEGILLPSTTFHKTSDKNEVLIPGTRDGEFVTLGSIEYPILHRLQINYNEEGLL